MRWNAPKCQQQTPLDDYCMHRPQRLLFAKGRRQDSIIVPRLSLPRSLKGMNKTESALPKLMNVCRCIVVMPRIETVDWCRVGGGVLEEEPRVPHERAYLAGSSR